MRSVKNTQTIANLLAKAQTVKDQRPQPLLARDLIPVIKVLRSKGLTYKEIQKWLKAEGQNYTENYLYVLVNADRPKRKTTRKAKTPSVARNGAHGASAQVSQ